MLVNNNLAAVEAWIKHGGDVNAAVSDGKTPLHLALELVNLDIADLLVNSGADTNTPATDGNTPLHLAVAEHNPAMVALLVKAGANLEATNVAGETPCTTLLDKASLFTKEQMISVNYRDVIQEIMQSMPLVKAMLHGAPPSTEAVSHIEDIFKAMMNHYYTMFGKYPSDTFKFEQLTLPFLAAREVWKNAASLTEANEMFAHSVSLMRLIDPFNEGVVAEVPHVDVAGAADSVVDAAC